MISQNWNYVICIGSGVLVVVFAADKHFVRKHLEQPANYILCVKNDNGNDNKKWKIEGVENFLKGNYLYYKITSMLKYKDTGNSAEYET